MRKASPEDVQRLVALMVEFYAEGGYPLNHQRAAEAFAALLADDRLGHVWFIQADSQDVGHAKRGVRAILVETGRDNVAAQNVYRRVGFVNTDRQLLALRLADPTHVG